MPKNTQSTVAGLGDTNPALSELELLTPFSVTGFAENDFAMNRFVHSLTESHDCVPGPVLGAEDTGGLGADFVEFTANWDKGARRGTSEEPMTNFGK